MYFDTLLCHSTAPPALGQGGPPARNRRACPELLLSLSLLLLSLSPLLLLLLILDYTILYHTSLRRLRAPAGLPGTAAFACPPRDPLVRLPFQTLTSFMFEECWSSIEGFWPEEIEDFDVMCCLLSAFLGKFEVCLKTLKLPLLSCHPEETHRRVEKAVERKDGEAVSWRPGRPAQRGESAGRTEKGTGIILCDITL